MSIVKFWHDPNNPGKSFYYNGVIEGLDSITEVYTQYFMDSLEEPTNDNQEEETPQTGKSKSPYS